MKTLESSRLARMTTTERANHNRIKREILDARGPERPGWMSAAVTFDERFKLPDMSVTADPENPRRLSIDVTVQLAGNILETDPFALGSLPDAEVVVSWSTGRPRGTIVRRSGIGDEAFTRLVNAGVLAPVKRPGDGTARDYVVTAGNVVFSRSLEYHSGETIPDAITASTITYFANVGLIELAK